MILKTLFASLVTLLLSLSSASFAQNNYPNWGKDVGAAKDHPAIQRFAGSWIVGYRQTEWDVIDLPVNEQLDNEKFKNLATVEGKVTHISY
jgi:OOP family OmpA-OmpF porin